MTDGHRGRTLRKAAVALSPYLATVIACGLMVAAISPWTPQPYRNTMLLCAAGIGATGIYIGRKWGDGSD